MVAKLSCSTVFYIGYQQWKHQTAKEFGCYLKDKRQTPSDLTFTLLCKQQASCGIFLSDCYFSH